MLKINDKEVAGLPITKNYAKTQEEYITVPCNFKDGIAAMEFELSDEDIEDIIKHKKIFLFRVLGNAKMQPFYIAANKEEFRDALYYNRNEIKTIYSKARDEKLKPNAPKPRLTTDNITPRSKRV